MRRRHTTRRPPPPRARGTPIHALQPGRCNGHARSSRTRRTKQKLRRRRSLQRWAVWYGAKHMGRWLGAGVSVRACRRSKRRPNGPGRGGPCGFGPPRGRLAQLFPTLISFREKSILSKITSLINVPVVLLLALTVPVVEIAENSADENAAPVEPVSGSKVTPAVATAAVSVAVAAPVAADAVAAAPTTTPAEPPPDDDEIEAKWNRYLFTIQCSIIPIFVVFGIGGARRRGGPSCAQDSRPPRAPDDMGAGRGVHARVDARTASGSLERADWKRQLPSMGAGADPGRCPWPSGVVHHKV